MVLGGDGVAEVDDGGGDAGRQVRGDVGVEERSVVFAGVPDFGDGEGAFVVGVGGVGAEAGGGQERWGGVREIWS